MRPQQLLAALLVAPAPRLVPSVPGWTLTLLWVLCLAAEEVVPGAEREGSGRQHPGDADGPKGAVAARFFPPGSRDTLGRFWAALPVGRSCRPAAPALLCGGVNKSAAKPELPRHLAAGVGGDGVVLGLGVRALRGGSCCTWKQPWLPPSRKTPHAGGAGHSSPPAALRGSAGGAGRAAAGRREAAGPGGAGPGRS